MRAVGAGIAAGAEAAGATVTTETALRDRRVLSCVPMLT